MVGKEVRIRTEGQRRFGYWIPETGFSFQAGDRTFRPIISHSMSSTLMPIFEAFPLFFIIF